VYNTKQYDIILFYFITNTGEDIIYTQY